MMKKAWLFYLVIALLLVSAFILRISNITQLPPYWEEVALGYDAYSILKTGKDHHGNSWPIVAFESFGDWKPSLYFYSVVPFVQVFRLNILAVRLPSILSGVAIVGGVGMLLYLISKKQSFGYAQDDKLLAVIGMAVTAISPWALMFSRGGWEVNFATALVLWGVVAGIQSNTTTNRKSFYLLLTSAFLLILSMYTYHAARLIAPLLGLSIAVLYVLGHRSTAIGRQLINVVIVGVFSLVLLSPLLINIGTQQTSQRFAETSIFTDLSIIEESNTLKENSGNTVFARLLYHRYVLFGQEVLINYFSHFRLDFLFLSGDLNPRHSTQYFGQLYHIELVFLLLGIYYLFKHWNRYHAFLLLWLLIGIIPASITQASPHALRILPTLPVWMILISYGIYFLSDKAIKRYSTKAMYLILAIVCGVYVVEFTAFWRYYTRIYPVVQAHEWQYGYEELIKNVELRSKASLAGKNHEKVFITREYGRPAMYYWFYTATDPQLVQANEAAALKDQGEILTYEHINFIRSVAEVDQVPALVASSQESYLELSKRMTTNKKEEIKDPRGKTIWVIYEIEE